MKKLLFSTLALCVALSLDAQVKPQKFSRKEIKTHLNRDTNPNLVYIQQADWQNGSGSFVTEDNKGFFSADDFTLSETKEIKNIEFLGYQVEDNLAENFLGAHLYIYEDDGGKPAGVPGNGVQPLLMLKLEKNSPRLAIEKVEEQVYDFVVDTSGFVAEANKTYWVLFAPKVKMKNLYDTTSMWNWFFSPDYKGADAMFVDADNYYGVNLTDWYSLYAAYGSELGENLKGLCMALYDYNYLSAENLKLSKDVNIYPNPAVSEFTVKAGDFVKAEILDMTGRLIKTSTSKTTNISSLSKGIYNVRIELKDGRLVLKKLIKN